MRRKLSLSIAVCAVLAVVAATVAVPSNDVRAGDRTAKLQQTLDKAVAAGIPGGSRRWPGTRSKPS
jgi:hypothetical protein